MKRAIFQITIGVADVDRSTAFYRDVLGFPVLTGFEDMVFIELEGMWLSIAQRDYLAESIGVSSAGSGFHGFQLSYHADSKEQVEQILIAAQNAGGTIIRAAAAIIPTDYSGVFADPDGFLWDVSWCDKVAWEAEVQRGKQAAKDYQAQNSAR